MNYLYRRKRVIMLLTALLLAFSNLASAFCADSEAKDGKKYIKWVDFTIPQPIMKRALSLDIASREKGEDPPLSWVELLAYLGARYGGDFGRFKTAHMDEAAKRLRGGETMAQIAEKYTLYSYYLEAYGAVLGGLVGAYALGTVQDGETVWEEKYGLRAYHPLARGFDYSHYDDFGNGRSYGYKRRHLGHDLMALTGTPVVAVESGIVEELGWNQYGGWRIGIRSYDQKRYYYYAHLRKNRPYAEGLEKGAEVLAGDVIGYVGRTGYSRNENTNGISQSHLHFGLQLIFDESQKDGVNQIWIDLYELTKLLSARRCEVSRNPETKEYTRVKPYREISPPAASHPRSTVPPAPT